MSNKVALVLQGGGVRGAYTSGVLDLLMENNIEFDIVLGVSAGSLNGQNYVSRQLYRNKWCCTVLMQNKKFFSKKNIFKYKSLFNFDYYFKEGEKDFPFDEKTFYENKTRYIACATNLNNGEPIYFEKGVCKDMIRGIVASSSLPLVSAPVFVEGTPCLDGGVAVVAPYRKAKELGYDKIVVVLTRNKGYRKTETKKKHIRLAKFLYRKYKKFLEVFANQHNIYNDIISEIETASDNKEIFLFQPKDPINLKNTDLSVDNMNDLYDKGYNEAKEKLADLKAYINE